MKNITITLFTSFLTLLSISSHGQDSVANVQLIHNAPDDTLQKIDVYVNKPSIGFRKVVNDLDFRDATSLLSVPLDPNGLRIGIAPKSSNSINDTLASFEFPLQPDENYVAVAEGILPLNRSDYNSYKPFDVSIFNTRQKSPVNTTTTILTHHGSPGADLIEIQETKQQNVSSLVKDLAFGEFSEEEVLPTQNYELVIKSSDSNKVLGRFSAPLDSLGYEDSAITIFTSGFSNFDKKTGENSTGPGFGLYTALLSGEVEKLSTIQDGKVQLINNIADTGIKNIDVFVNGSRKAANLSFREATPFIPLPPNQEVDLALAKTGKTISDTLKVFSLNVKANTNYIAVANGIVSKNGYRPNKPLQLPIFKGAKLKASQGGNTDVLFHNGATDLPTIDVVETIFNEGRELVSELAYPEFANDYIEINADDYRLEVQQTIDGSTIKTFNGNFYNRGLLDSAILAFTSGFRKPGNNSNGPALTLSLAYPHGKVVNLENISGVTKIDNQLNFRVYPNPVDDKLSMSLGQNDIGQRKVDIMTVDGQVVKTFSIKHSNNTSLKLDGLKAGVYFIRVFIKGQSIGAQPIIKE